MRKYRKKKENEINRQPIERIFASSDQGLTLEQVNERTEKGWDNAPVDPPSKTVEEIIFSNVFTYFNLVFVVLAVLLIIVGAFNNLTFLPVIISNTLIGIVQEIRSKKTLDKLNVLNAPKVNVIRDGTLVSIPAEDAVLDDVAEFGAGNQICADGIVLSGEVSVNESLLTGEAEEIIKKAGDKLYSGSYIVSGSCRARLEQIGADCYASQLTLEAKAMKQGEQSEMMRSLNRLVKIVGILIIPIGIILLYQQYLIAHNTLRQSVEGMVAAVIGMIPEGLYLLASVALVVSVMRLAKKKVLVHDMKCIESLARVNVLCVDKTGTITENTMTVHKLIPLKQSTVTPETDVIPISNTESKTDESLELLIGDFAAAMSSDNATMQAIKSYFRKNTGINPTAITSFSSTYKYSSATFDEDCYILGAPEFVLREDYETYKEIIENHSNDGYRVLVFGTYLGMCDGKMLTEKVVPLGLLLLENPIRTEAWETFQYFADQGVEIKVISGDNPVTVSKVAARAGISKAANYIDASTLVYDKEIEDAVLKYTVFGRVTPAQKRKFVNALKKAGKTVAMTGDGVNDVLALKDADCSIAMASGSDAAAQASQLVLLESDFSCLPSVVLEGRRVVNNLQRSGSLFLVKNIYSFLLSIFSMILLINYPLEPSQVSLIGIFTIGTPAFLLAMEPNHKLIQGKFISNILLTALPAGLTDFLIVSFLSLFGITFGLTTEEISTTATFLLAIVGFMILFKISHPMNKFRWLVWGCMIIGLAFCFIVLPGMFSIGPLTEKCVMVLIVFSVATEPIFRYLSHGLSRLQRRQKRRKL